MLRTTLCLLGLAVAVAVDALSLSPVPRTAHCSGNEDALAVICCRPRQAAKSASLFFVRTDDAESNYGEVAPEATCRLLEGAKTLKQPRTFSDAVNEKFGLVHIFGSSKLRKC